MRLPFFFNFSKEYFHSAIWGLDLTIQKFSLAAKISSCHVQGRDVGVVVKSCCWSKVMFSHLCWHKNQSQKCPTDHVNRFHLNI